ncbi:MAG: hypothetical protein ABWY25_02610 [Paenisporosarcina sp.]
MSDTEMQESSLPSFGDYDQPQETVQEQEPIPEDLGLAEKFLPNVPPQDRAVISRYIKEWDAGVTKRFQEYSNKLKPYESLGPADELQKYVNLARNFQADPENVFRIMWHAMQQHYGEEFDQQLLRILELEGVDVSEFQPPVGDEYDDPDQVFQQNVSTELEELRNWRQAQEQEKIEAQQNQQLDAALSAMHTKYGDFDDNWILVRIAEHGNVDQAIKEWNAMLGKYGATRGAQRLAPKTLGGQGGVPSNQVDPKKLRGKDRRDIVAQMLSQGE